jgi:hypothetical protein
VERILSDLLRRLWRSEKAVQDAEHRPAVSVVQLAEGNRISTGDPRNKRSIVTSCAVSNKIRVGDG